MGVLELIDSHAGAGNAMQGVPAVTTRASIVSEPRAAAQQLRAKLGPHPVPQSDPRTRGLLLELNRSDADRDWLRRDFAPLVAVLSAVGDRRPEALVLAVNETPPTDADTFLMMPHVDRRYGRAGFTASAPARTTVVMLDFPPDGVGGELVAFDSEQLRCNSPASRLGARAAVARAGGYLLPPTPGTAYELAGTQPHAVLGYEAAAESPWRLVVVIAEFAAQES